MDATKRHSILLKLRTQRDEAAEHLRRTQRQQREMETFLPAISQAVIMELSDFIERLNVRVEVQEEALIFTDHQNYIQEAFSFLHECVIDEQEIPF